MNVIHIPAANVRKGDYVEDLGIVARVSSFNAEIADDDRSIPLPKRVMQGKFIPAVVKARIIREAECEGYRDDADKVSITTVGNTLRTFNGQTVLKVWRTPVAA